MRIKKTLLTCILLLAGIYLLRAQGLHIRMQDGTENQVLISAVSKLSFSGDQLVMTPKSGSPDYYNLADIKKLYFGVITSTPAYSISGTDRLTIFPNPSDLLITVLNIPTDVNAISVYSIDGRLVQEITVSAGLITIDISGLKSGIYFLAAGRQTIKFIKS